MHRVQQAIVDLSKRKNLDGLTLNQIAKELNLRSPQIAKYHLDKLKSLGFNSSEPNSFAFKANELVELVSIPIVGAANCGPATIFADQRIEGYLKISSRLLQSSTYEGLFALRAKGRSMNKARVNNEPIRDGDYVIVNCKQRQPKNGDYVVAVVDELANIKRFYLDRLNAQVALVSESSDDFAPIFLHSEDAQDSIIAGKVVQVISNPSFA